MGWSIGVGWHGMQVLEYQRTLSLLSQSLKKQHSKSEGAGARHLQALQTLAQPQPAATATAASLEPWPWPFLAPADLRGGEGQVPHPGGHWGSHDDIGSGSGNGSSRGSNGMGSSSGRSAMPATPRAMEGYARDDGPSSWQRPRM